ncbi:MAG TPA: HEPN family nuclease [Candidatus Avalokitesvara rifleensis]|uniref:HEPN family nuclease n=1 Tax=Candidatus Avalokitesvara rifleensis TaxID=3367620 RepID=UPI0027136DAC|nr:HEPN family nuclease [Candidatus Brocadiales bacterium]
MEYTVFERDFIVRTLKIIDQYEECVMPRVPEPEQFEVTLLINCLLGLLVLPKERCHVNIPDEPINELDKWGLKAEYIINPGIGRSKDRLTLRQVVKDMRNSVAHLLIHVTGKEEKITHIEFSTDRTNSRQEFQLIA